MKCDVCETTKDVIAGRWIFYCPKHKEVEQEKILENELRGDESDVEYMIQNSEAFEFLI